MAAPAPPPPPITLADLMTIVGQALNAIATLTNQVQDLVNEVQTLAAMGLRNCRTSKDTVARPKP
jgi:hypothetical protein